MVLIDDEKGSYRTSEVARLLLEQLEAQACMCDDVPGLDADGKVPDEQMPPVETHLSATPGGKTIAEVKPKNASIPFEAVEADFAAGEARVQLQKIAHEAILAGNVKAAYIIERALREMHEAQEG